MIAFCSPNCNLSNTHGASFLPCNFFICTMFCYLILSTYQFFFLPTRWKEILLYSFCYFHWMRPYMIAKRHCQFCWSLRDDFSANVACCMMGMFLRSNNYVKCLTDISLHPTWLQYFHFNIRVNLLLLLQNCKQVIFVVVSPLSFSIGPHTCPYYCCFQGSYIANYFWFQGSYTAIYFCFQR